MTSPDRFNKVMEIFDRVCDARPEDRPALLDEACQGDDALRREVETLLDHDAKDCEAVVAAERGDGADMFAASLMTDSSSEGGPAAQQLPERIGQFRILRVIGQGGMGTVYEAEQENPRRRVALKVIRSGSMLGQIVKRFQHEAHVLGLLQHPGIAQVYEAGFGQAGNGKQPYFAMELVDGCSLDEFADQRNLCARARMEVIARTCDAVHYAHEKGIIHRDLKPANILVVTGENGRTGEPLVASLHCGTSPPCGMQAPCTGQPKVLDFGVARITDADMQMVTLRTEVGQLVGTLSYMSPEQVVGRPGELDRRSDIYALGVILHELLAGKLPYDIHEYTIPQAVSIIRDEEPSRLGSINSIYRGDIETIVSKAMEKDRERRYQSAAEMAADIRRFLLDEPITARPASTFYQLGKFTRRNKGLVGGIATTMLALVIGLAGTVYWLIQTTEARDKAEAAAVAESVQREAAQEAWAEDQLSREVAEAVTTFLAELLASADPGGQGKDVTVREVMNRAADSIGERFSQRPLVEAEIRSTIGRTLVSLGEYDEAAKQLEQATDLWRDLPHNRDSQSLEARAMLGEAYYFQGRHEEAAGVCTSNLEDARQLYTTDDSELIPYISNVAFLEMQKGHVGAAESLFLEAVSISEAAGDEVDPVTLDLKSNLALLYTRQRRVEDAEPLYLEAIEQSRRVRGAEDPATILIVANLASLYITADRLSDAARLLEEVLEIQGRVLGESHSKTLITLNNLAVIFLRNKQFSRAEALLRDGLSRSKGAYGDADPSTLTLMFTLGQVFSASERFDEAERILTTTLGLDREVFGDNHRETQWTMNELVKLYLAKSEWLQAVSLAEELVNSAAPSGGTPARASARWRVGLARGYAGMKRFSDAEAIFLECYSQVDPKRKRNIKGYLAELYDSWGKADEADKWRAKVETKTTPEGAKHP